MASFVSVVASVGLSQFVSKRQVETLGDFTQQLTRPGVFSLFRVLQSSDDRIRQVLVLLFFLLEKKVTLGGGDAMYNYMQHN